MRLRTSGPRGLAILRYAHADQDEHRPRRNVPHPPEREDKDWSLRHARRYRAKKRVQLPPPSRTLVFLGTQNVAMDGRLVWAMNNVSYAAQSTPALHAIALDVEEETGLFVETTEIPTVFDYNRTLDEVGISNVTNTGTQVVKIALGEVVDFVFQNTRALGGADEVHPWYVLEECNSGF